MIETTLETKCRICGNSENNKFHEVREMMFGLRETFRYFQCSFCGCLQIASIPTDMAKYYPAEYYSFQNYNSNESRLRSYLKKIRDRFAVSGKGVAGKILYRFFPDKSLKLYTEFYPHSRILDVGCGAGQLLLRLQQAGFRNLSGIDPLNPYPVTYRDGLTIEKKSISEMSGQWDLITYHHSFEHIASPLEELRKIAELLSDNGKCVLRVPVADSWAWEHYETDWVQIDAPRHFYLYSLKSLGILAEKTGLTIEEVEYDSTEFQFWGSEQYNNDISLRDKKSYYINPALSFFTKKDIISYCKKALELNHLGKGDQAKFKLKRRR